MCKTKLKIITLLFVSILLLLLSACPSDSPVPSVSESPEVECVTITLQIPTITAFSGYSEHFYLWKTEEVIKDSYYSPSNPVSSDFRGWYRDIGLTRAWIVGEDKATVDLTLYAKYE